MRSSYKKCAAGAAHEKQNSRPVLHKFNDPHQENPKWKTALLPDNKNTFLAKIAI
jgi:hypothetical protein